MEFKKYSSIENSYRIKFIDQIKTQGYANEIYVVQEKVHGANYSIWTDGIDIKAAKRTSFIEEGSNFYKSEDIVDKYRQDILHMFAYLKTNKQAEVITLSGELIGGSYPHADVKRFDNAAKVQKGVFYIPHNDFIGFDIFVNGKLIPINEMEELYSMFNFKYTKALFTGQLDDCLKYQNEFQTTIPALYGLPEIENNTCEGIVIKTNFPKFLGNGGRVIIKSKNKAFSEKKQVSDKRQQKTKQSPMSGAVLTSYEEITKFITENRLKNVLSKLGPVTEKDFGKILSSFNKDIVEDFRKDFELFSTLDKKSQKQITKEMTKVSSSLIRDNFINILDGEF